MGQDGVQSNGPDAETTTTFDPNKVATVEVPVDEIKLSEDIPNFKEGADPETGVVSP